MSWSDYMWGRVAHDLFWIGLVISLLVVAFIIMFSVTYIRIVYCWIMKFFTVTTTRNVSKNNLLVRSKLDFDLLDKKEKKYSN